MAHPTNQPIVLDDGLMYMLISQGADKSPREGDLVAIIYNTFRDDGNPVEENQALAFVYGKDQVIEALDRGVGRMKLGEVASIIAAPKYAYGDRGLKPHYGPNDTITFHITLTTNHGQFDPRSELPLDGRLAIANFMKERGNFLFVRNQCDRAINAYKVGLEYMYEHSQSYNTTTEDEVEIGVFSLKTYNNITAAYLKIGSFAEADRCASAVLGMDGTNAKALFRKGMALKGLGDYQMSLSFLQCALQAEPSNTIIKEEICRVEALIKGPVEAEAAKSAEKTENTPVKTTPVDTQTSKVKSDNTSAEPAADVKPTASNDDEKVKESKGKQMIPSWVKWAAGATALVGIGFIAYKFYKK